jgi:hypothetical protein
MWPEGKMNMKLAVALLALLFATNAFAQTAAPKADKRSAQVKPQAPMGCKLVGPVRGTNIWSGDCVGAVPPPRVVPQPPPPAEWSSNPPDEKQ